MENHEDLEVRLSLQREMGHRRSTAPGLLKAWTTPPEESAARLKEVIAIIRPEQWARTKERLQRLGLLAFTHHRVLGRGRERGLRYLPRQGAGVRTGVSYLPKRMVTFVVEEPQVSALVQAIIETNRTGRLGDGKIFILPLEGAVRIRTGDRGVEALRPERQFETAWGTVGRVEPKEGSDHAAGQ